MAKVRLEGVFKKFGPLVAVNDVNMDIKDNEFVTILGPSGCGKTTTLRIIGGLEAPSEGRVYFDSEDVTEIPPENRDCAMVFQSYALYPHMTAYDNIAFPLKLRKVPKDKVKERVQSVADLLSMRELLARYPGQLSGGQRQRVALGRAIVRQPKVFLMDEPLGSLDANLRVLMRHEIKKLHERLEATFIYVTHDQDDALSMGDRVAVMSDGKLQQFGPPSTIYNFPVNKFVARFVGKYQMNFFSGRLETSGDDTFFRSDDLSFRLAPSAGHIKEIQHAESMTLGIRPEGVLVKMGSANPDSISAQVSIVEPVEPDVYLILQVGARTVTAKTHSQFRPRIGEIVFIEFDQGKILLFDDTTDERIKTNSEQDG